MEDSGGKRLTNTFRFKHHTMPVPTITPTNRIIAATRDLTAAISGIQEAPPDKLQAITTLRYILLGKVPPTPVPINPPSIAPVPPPIAAAVDKEPIHIWDPNAHPLQHVQDAIVPGTTTMPGQHAAGPVFIDNNDDSPVAPSPCAAQTARTHAQHCTQQWVHLINLVITEALMPMIDMEPAALFPAHGYIAATCALLGNTYGVIRPANSPFTSDSINFIGAIVNDITGDVLEYHHLIKSDTHCAIWQKCFANELGRLFQGIRNIKGTDTCFFIRKNQMPSHKRATYGCICCNYCPQKDEPHCTWLTVGGDHITYTGDKSTPTANLVTAKLLINSMILTPNAKFYGMDLSNFYLMMPMKEYEYMCLCLDLIPNKIVQKYNLHNLIDDQGWVYVEIRMGI
jgi:hypothetical protein